MVRGEAAEHFKRRQCFTFPVAAISPRLRLRISFSPPLLSLAQHLNAPSQPLVQHRHPLLDARFSICRSFLGSRSLYLVLYAHTVCLYFRPLQCAGLWSLLQEQRAFPLAAIRSLTQSNFVPSHRTLERFFYATVPGFSVTLTRKQMIATRIKENPNRPTHNR